ncbi:hypothetical protein [Mesorhizobium sp. GbtcB19]|uniref:hypothetical protein n=1 Tax=Mesorhizobium sp. GbtcB19 TaxID=2824764 RepID=UPI001C2F38C8|nr:hypothetical protein [Mesorhizobium sp. GbtcB19]
MKRLTETFDGLKTTTGRQCCTAELPPKKVGVEAKPQPVKNQLIQADKHIGLARPAGRWKARESAISASSIAASAWWKRSLWARKDG